MNIELHLIQNFAPSNLNRSDTGTPKECEFGGVRRARVSSQCFKRAIRDHFDKGAVFSEPQKQSLAKRTLRLMDELVKRLTDKEKLETEAKSEEEARRVSRIVLNSGGLEVKKDEKGIEKTEYLLFLGEREIQGIAKLCLDNWPKLMETDAAYEKSRQIESQIERDELEAKAIKLQAKEQLQEMKKMLKKGTAEEMGRLQDELKKEEEAIKKQDQQAAEAIKTLKKDLKDSQDAAKNAIPTEIADAVLEILDGGQAADLALFGRMLANLPKKNRDAACQVAHAISTHKVGVEFDFYTAVDDLLPTGETGAGMMGTVEFNSACFYRYANIDVKQLTTNLGNDAELAHATIEAFIRSMIHAIPTGKQNSMAAQNLPSFVLAVVRPSGFWSLANAFVNPVKSENIVNDSIQKLDEYWGQLTTVYGSDGITKAYVNLSGNDLANLNGARQASINDLVMATFAAVKKGA